MHIVLCYNHRSQGKRIHELEDKLACVLSKVRRLEKKMDRMPAKKKEYSDNEGEKLMHLIAHLSPEQDKDRRAIVKTLALQVFKEEDLATHSLSGKKGPKQVGDCLPALDQAKLSFLERMVHQNVVLTTKTLLRRCNWFRRLFGKLWPFRSLKKKTWRPILFQGRKVQSKLAIAGLLWTSGLTY